MANRFWDHVATLVSGQTARANLVNAQLDGVMGGFENVEQEMNRAIRFNDGTTPLDTTFQLSQTALQRANLIMAFNAAGALELRAGTFTWRNNWATATGYSVNDVVIGPTANNNSLYICVLAHTSGVFATDLGAGRWQLMVDLLQVNRAIRKFQIVTSAMSPFLATPGDDLFVDVTGGAVTVTLPAAPVILDQAISVTHMAGNIAANNITIARNGNPIMALAEDMTVNTTNASFELAFANASAGWRLVKGT